MSTSPVAHQFERDFPLDSTILGSDSAAKLSVSGSTDHDVVQAILTDSPFPQRDRIDIGHIQFETSAGKQVKFQAGSAQVQFSLSGGVSGGAGVFSNPADALASLSLDAPPQLDLALPSIPSARYLLMRFGYDISGSASGSHPIGALGSLTFGVEAKRESLFAVVHAFPATAGAHTALSGAISSWRLPRQVTFENGAVNLKPATWLIAEVDGSLGINIGAQLGYDVVFEHAMRGLPQNLSAKVDAGLKATFGFDASGKFLVVVGRDSADAASASVRLRLFKQAKKGLQFALNLTAGIQGDVKLPERFDDFVQAVFGVYGPQVIKDLHAIEKWTDPNADLGGALAGLANKEALALLQQATGLSLPAQFDEARQQILKKLDAFEELPDRVAAVLWKYREQLVSTGLDELQKFLSGVANGSLADRGQVLAQAITASGLAGTTVADWLRALAGSQGLLALQNQVDVVSAAARRTLDALDGGILGKLQASVEKALDLDQIRKAMSDTDFDHVDGWLVQRLGNFLNKQLARTDLKEIQQAIQSLDEKARKLYAAGLEAANKRYTAEFGVTYQKTASGAALLDVTFDLSKPNARSLFESVMADSNLDTLLTKSVPGVEINQATLSHELTRQSTVELHLPKFDFVSTHVNEAMASLTIEQNAGRVLVYSVSAKDSVTSRNRSLSELAVTSGIQVEDGKARFTGSGTIAYEMLQAKREMSLVDFESRVNPFVHSYLMGQFPGGDAALQTFYADLDRTAEALLQNGSNRLGDVALSMQVTYPGSVLAGWFMPSSSATAKQAPMILSRALQTQLRRLLPSFYFADLKKLCGDPAAAALLVWSSLPISTSVRIDNGSVTKLDTGDDVFWDWPDRNVRAAMARHPQTVASLAVKMAAAQNRLREVQGSGNAETFDPTQAIQFINTALSTGDTFLTSLLFVEAQMIEGAKDALKDVQRAMDQAATAPSQAVEKLAEFAADLTETFHSRLASIYGSDSLRTLGPMILAEASAALSPSGAKPQALLQANVLAKNSTFDLNSFLTGAVPSRDQVAVAQLVTSLS